MILNKFIIKDIIILFTVSILFMYGIDKNDAYITIGCIMFLLILNVIFALKNIEERIIFLIFQITFFTFLVGRLLFYFVFDITDINIIGFNYTNATISFIFISVFISLFFLRLGYVITEVNSKEYRIELLDYETNYIQMIRKWSKIFMYVALLPQLAILIEKAILVKKSGYEAYYTDYISNLPYIISKLGSLYDAVTFLFLATMPAKKECKLPLIIFFIVGSLSLGYGQRNGFVLNSIFIFIYLIVRNQINSGGIIWFKRKYILPVIIIIPFLLTFLLAFGSYRSGEKFDSKSLTYNASLFFISQGNSASLIGFAKEIEDEIPDNKFYSLGPGISFFKENALAKVFFDVPQHQVFTQAQALDGHQFSMAISYLYYKEAFLRGFGLGSCYIAELWIDFGYIGIVLGSLIFGILMAKFISFCRRSVWLATVAFSGAVAIIYAPRAEFLGFLEIIFSFKNLIVFFLIHILAKKDNHDEKNPIYL